jgi:hypothetical protein
VNKASDRQLAGGRFMTNVARSHARGDDRRLEPRLEFGRPGMLRFDDGAAVEAMVLDLNRDGCRLTTAASLTPGAWFSLGIAPIGRIRTRAVWHGPTGYGCEFETPLPAGAVTAAFGPSNVATLPGTFAPAASRGAAAKLTPRVRFAAQASAVVLSWTLLAAGWLVLR